MTGCLCQPPSAASVYRYYLCSVQPGPLGDLSRSRGKGRRFLGGGIRGPNSPGKRREGGGAQKGGGEKLGKWVYGSGFQILHRKKVSP